jgi:glucosamine-6-phosphate deaminase
MKMVDSFEKIPLDIFPNATAGSAFVAKKIARLIREKEKNKERCVLGLSTGKSPLKLYAELIRMHKEEGLSFKNVVAFNLDEYYPIQRTATQSYYRFMKENLFDHIDIDPKNCFIPNGELPKEDMKSFCAEYEQAITDAGGIDLQILGIGSNGHIGLMNRVPVVFPKRG